MYIYFFATQKKTFMLLKRKKISLKKNKTPPLDKGHFQIL